MKVQLRVNVTDIGKDGATVDVDDDKGTWLIAGGYAVEVASAAPVDSEGQSS